MKVVAKESPSKKKPPSKHLEKKPSNPATHINTCGRYNVEMAKTACHIIQLCHFIKWLYPFNYALKLGRHVKHPATTVAFSGISCGQSLRGPMTPL